MHIHLTVLWHVTAVNRRCREAEGRLRRSDYPLQCGQHGGLDVPAWCFDPQRATVDPVSERSTHASRRGSAERRHGPAECRLRQLPGRAESVQPAACLSVDSVRRPEQHWSATFQCLNCREVKELGVVSFRLISFRYRRQSGLGLGLGLSEMRLGEMRPNQELKLNCFSIPSPLHTCQITRCFIKGTPFSFFHNSVKR